MILLHTKLHRNFLSPLKRLVMHTKVKKTYMVGFLKNHDLIDNNETQ